MRPVGPLSFSELSPPRPSPLAPPMPMPPNQAIPKRYEHPSKRHQVLMDPPAPPVPLSLRPATTSGGSANDFPQLAPLNVGSSGGTSRFLTSSAEDVKRPVRTPYTDGDEIAAAAQLYHYYLEPSVRLLAQNRLVVMGAIRPGLYGGKVGFLPGLHGDFMDNYEVRIGRAACALHVC